MQYTRTCSKSICPAEQVQSVDSGMPAADWLYSCLHLRQPQPLLLTPAAQHVAALHCMSQQGLRVQLNRHFHLLLLLLLLLIRVMPDC